MGVTRGCFHGDGEVLVSLRVTAVMLGFFRLGFRI